MIYFIEWQQNGLGFKTRCFEFSSRIGISFEICWLVFLLFGKLAFLNIASVKVRKMAYWIVAFLVLVFQTVQAISVPDRTTIEQVIQDHESSWNLNECRGFGKDYSENATFINIFGMQFAGSEEIEKRHIQILQTFLKNSKFTVLEISLREVHPELVIANVHWQLTNFHMPKTDLSKPGETKEGMFTHVFVKNREAWKIESSQNTLLTLPSNR